MRARLEVRTRSTLDLVRSFARAAAVEGPTVVDRVRIRVEGRRPEPPATRRLPTSDGWLEHLHGLLEEGWPCPPCTDFPTTVWAPIRTRVGAAPEGRDRHDGDSQLAHAAWSVTHHLRPAAVVETGVARGMTSASILSALRASGEGRLYSVDLPPLSKGWAEQSGLAVRPELRPQWTYVRGSTRRRLPPLLARVGPIDVFIHDSLHTFATMAFEFGCAWESLRPGGVMISDDIDDNAAFEQFVEDHGNPQTVIGVEPSKSGGRFGVVRKSGP